MFACASSCPVLSGASRFPSSSLAPNRRVFPVSATFSKFNLSSFLGNHSFGSFCFIMSWRSPYNATPAFNGRGFNHGGVSRYEAKPLTVENNRESDTRTIAYTNLRVQNRYESRECLLPEYLDGTPLALPGPHSPMPVRLLCRVEGFLVITYVSNTPWCLGIGLDWCAAHRCLSVPVRVV